MYLEKSHIQINNIVIIRVKIHKIPEVHSKLAIIEDKFHRMNAVPKWFIKHIHSWEGNSSGSFSIHSYSLLYAVDDDNRDNDKREKF